MNKLFKKDIINIFQILFVIYAVIKWSSLSSFSSVKEAWRSVMFSGRLG